MNIFDKVIKTKKEPNEISESSEIQDLIEKERSRHERPVKAYSRGVIEGTGT